jgi:signal transduction histidine kinase
MERGDGFCREFIEQSFDAIFRIDFDEPIPTDLAVERQCELFFRSGTIRRANPAFHTISRLFGVEENADGSLRPVTGHRLPFEEQSVRVFFSNKFRLDGLELMRVDENGHERFFELTLTGVVADSALACVWVRLHESTVARNARRDLDEFEKQSRLTQKIEALGRLAGGVAHDFNNFLAVIMLQNDMLNLQLPSGSPLRNRTEEMKKATAKAASMVRQLMAVGRKQTLNPQPTEINRVVEEFARNVPSLIGEGVNVVTDLPAQTGVCFVDRVQLLGALAELVENARDAMPDGGVVSIKTEDIVLDKTSVMHKSQPEGAFVQITVTDTGTGMDPTTLESVFEPFFSTKNKAKGVGLGLAMVYGFIKQSRGFIWVTSRLGRGTTFRIQFPRIDQPSIQENDA